MKTYLVKIGVIMAFLGVSISGMSQMSKIANDPTYGADSASRMECAQNLSSMSEFVKIKVYDYAYDPWKACFENCHGSSKYIYIQGAKNLKHKIENAETDEDKKNYLDMLMQLYDKRAEYFQEEGYCLGKKGLDLIKYDQEAIKTSYEYLKKSVELDGKEVDDAVAATLMTASTVLMQRGEIDPAELINNYVVTMEALNAKLKETRLKDRTEKAIENVEKTFAESGAADCESLVNIFTPKYETGKTDVEFLKKLTKMLDEADCKETELFAKASESLYSLEPSSEAAANLAKLFALRDELDKAASYYTEAIGHETDPIVKSEYNFQLGAIAFKNKEYPSAAKYAKLALGDNPNYGDAYILIGNSYAASSSDCGNSNFEKAAVYWVAVDKFAKAKSVDPGVAEKANELIGRYSNYFPNNEDAFFVGYTDGQAYTVGCWINENTTVRTKKN